MLAGSGKPRKETAVKLSDPERASNDSLNGCGITFWFPNFARVDQRSSKESSYAYSMGAQDTQGQSHLLLKQHIAAFNIYTHVFVYRFFFVRQIFCRNL
jgi:hypothetical protein